jgi:hypothetical protein
MVPIVVENDDAVPSVPLMAAVAGTVSAKVPAVSVTLTVVSPHTPPLGAVHAKAGAAGASTTEHKAAVQSGPMRFTGDDDLSGRSNPP